MRKRTGWFLLLTVLGLASSAGADPRPTIELPAIGMEAPDTLKQEAALETRITQSLTQREPRCVRLENRALVWRAITIGASTTAATLGGGSFVVPGGWETGLQIAGVVMTTIAATAGYIGHTYESRHERDCSIPSLLTARPWTVRP